MCSFLLEIGSFDCVPYGTSLRMTSPGDEGIRTPDLLLARQALSHLSYTPELLLLWVFAHKLDLFGSGISP